MELLTILFVPSGEVRIGIPIPLFEMEHLFWKTLDYLEHRSDSFEIDRLRDLSVLIATTTEERLETALRARQERFRGNVRFLVSGSRLRPHSVQPATDALLMAIWLLVKGVSRDEIIMEDMAADTFDNGRYGVRKVDAAIYSLMGRGEEVGEVQMVTFSEKNHLRRFMWFFFWLGLWRKIRQFFIWTPQIRFFYQETGPRLSPVQWIMEQGFFFGVHLLDPLGWRSLLALLSKTMRRRNARKP